MAESIIKYSELIEDDGGFEKTKEDLKRLGEEMVAEAKKIKDKVSLLDPKDIDALLEYNEKMDAVLESRKTQVKTLEVVHNAEKQANKQKKEAIKLEQLQDKSLTDLELQYKKLKSELKRVKKEEKEGIVNAKEAAERQSKLNVELKSVRKQRNKLQKEVVESNELSKEEKKLQDALITVDKNRKSTLNDIRARMSALRTVVQNTNLDTEEGRKKVERYNQEINELNQTLSDNSDTFVQNKINVGNYKESVKEALRETDFFNTGIGKLDDVLNNLTRSILGLSEQQDENAKATRKNAKETKGLRRAFRGLGKTLKATGILLLVTAFASLFAMFKQGRKGVIKTEKMMARLKGTVKVLISFLGDLGSALVGLFGALFSQISLLDDRISKAWYSIQRTLLQGIPGDIGQGKVKELDQKIAQIDKRLKGESGNAGKYFDEIKKVLGELGIRLEDGSKAVEQNFEAIYRAWEIEDKIKDTSLELIKLKSELRLFEIQSDDATRSFRSQLEATRSALSKNIEVLEKENEIRQLSLEKANAKARADLQANATSIGAKAKEILQIKDEAKFTEKLLQLNIDLEERKDKNPLDNQFLNESIAALKEYKEGLEEEEALEKENAKKIREIKLDSFEQDLDLLIDLMDREKQLNEQMVSDTTNNYKRRVKEFEAFIKKFGQNAKDQIQEFNELLEASGSDQEFDIQYNDDGSFKIFLDDQELALDNIKELNEQLKAVDLGENAIKRFLDVTQELQSARKDFKDTTKTLDDAGLKLKEIKGLQLIERSEIKQLDKVNEKLRELAGTDMTALSEEQKQKILDQIESLEEKKTLIEQKAEKKRLQNRIESINRELEIVEKGSEAEVELRNELLGLQKELSNMDYDMNLGNLKDTLGEVKDVWQEFGNELRQIMTEVFTQIEDQQRDSLESSKDKLDDQQDAVEDQRERAKQGLENSLAFEQKQLAEREKQMQKEQKKLEQIQKLKAYWNTYNANLQSLDQGESSNQAIIKTLRDMAVMEGITASLASFGEGGIVEDNLPSDGVFRGRSHKGNLGGIPVMVEGREGIFSTNEMDNLGKENFYAIKSMANRGPLDDDHFTSQKKDIMKLPVESSNNTHLQKELQDIKKVISNRPQKNFEVNKLADGMMEIVETVKKQNKEVRNHYRIRKPRL